METPRKNGRPPSGTRRLSREMMLGALIKWRLPYPAKEAARKKNERKRKIAGPPLPAANEKLSSFATLAIPTSAIAIVRERPI